MGRVASHSAEPLALPATMSEDMRAVVVRMVDALAGVPDLVAVALGGSHASGTARASSDTDLGIYYLERSPFRVSHIRDIALRFDEHPPPIVTDFYEWGPWVNGGAWIRTRAGRVDFLYRNVDHVRRVIEEATRGEASSDYFQTPAHGFHSVTYLGETEIAVPLHDPKGILSELKAGVTPYPPALKATIVQKSLWGAEFTLRFARDAAARTDLYNTVGSLTRALAHLTQALFALNERYFVNDKSAMEAIGSFAAKPEGYAGRVRRILSRPGESAEELRETVDELESLFRDVVAIAGAAYRPKYPAAVQHRGETP
jgi:hypothetical protein